MRKKLNNGKQFKFLYFLMTLMMAASLTGCSKVELSSNTIQLELGESLSEDVKDYVTAQDETVYEQMRLDITGVDQKTPGTYTASVVYNNDVYEFEVIVADTTAPELTSVDYLITKSGIIKAADVVTGCSDASETTVAIKAAKTGELDASKDTVISNEKAVVGAQAEYNPEELAEEISLTEEGCYEVMVVAIDAYQNMTVVTFNAYVDDTAPVMEQTATELTVDASSINLDEIESNDVNAVLEQLHALPGFTDLEFVTVSDNLNQDKVIFSEYEHTALNVKGEYPVEILSYAYKTVDTAGNESEATYELKVTYENLDAAALGKKTGLTSTAKKENSSGGSGNDVKMSPIEGLRADEIDAYITSLSTDEIILLSGMDFRDLRYDRETGDIIVKATGKSIWDENVGSNQTEDDATIEYFYDRELAQEVFALVNEERAANGLAAYTWDDNMVAYSDRRAQEIVTDFSHNSAGGKWNVGENIAEGQPTASRVMEAWMSSDGHRANILSSVSTRISVSCYVEKGTYQDGIVQYRLYWVQNFTH